MASRFLSGGLPGGRNTLDVPVAALAGLSVAFATFAAPADLLAELVAASGVSTFIPAAEPPLGMDARLAIGGGGAVLMFAIAFLLLRWLDRFGSRKELEIDDEPQLERPRLRRRDFHPDAPPRPPLAASELGEPNAEQVADRGHEPEPDHQPLPPVRATWLPEVTEPHVEEPHEAAPPPHAEPVQPQAHSLAELLDRLEQGLARRRAEPAERAAPSAQRVREAAPAPQVFPAADERLQSAIDSLQRLAARPD